jgi:hypothetical protein
MIWDRFDIVAAYYWYMVQWNMGGTTVRDDNRERGRKSISQQLLRLGYQPGLSVEYGQLNENAQAIYFALLRKYEGYSGNSRAA